MALVSKRSRKPQCILIDTTRCDLTAFLGQLELKHFSFGLDVLGIGFRSR